MRPIRVLPYELVQEHTQGKDDATDTCEVHWSGGTHRSTLRRRGVAPVRGGVVVPVSPPSTACGGAVAQRSSPSACCMRRGESEREREEMER